MDELGELLYAISQYPPDERDLPTIVGYHITAAANVASILANGLQARECEQSYTRPPAVYLFLEWDEVISEITNIVEDDYVVLRVTIPAEHTTLLKWDGLYNSGFDTRSAVQYLANIPADWIKEIK